MSTYWRTDAARTRNFVVSNAMKLNMKILIMIHAGLG